MSIDRKVIIFFGGCTGIDKSLRLKNAISSFEKEGVAEVIKISNFFIDKINKDGNSKQRNIIMWRYEDWKKFEYSVIQDLVSYIQTKQGIFIINNHFATISPYGYLPGLDMDNFNILLKECRPRKTETSLLKRQKKAEVKPVVGILLMDTKQEIIYNHYIDLIDKLYKVNTDKDTKEEIKNGINNSLPMLPYISCSEIQEDLDENRKWAEIYGLRARSIFPPDLVKTKVIYQEKAETNFFYIESEIKNFISEFAK
jgi:hypothetical protein